MTEELAASVVVYCGPSISPDEASQALPGALIAPPAQRGSLYEASASGLHNHVLIDGTFSHGFAVSPREVVDVLRAGDVVIGASSMGAIRAAECWPASMEGVGVVYRLFRLGVLTADDEVAVVTNPEAQYAAMTSALVTIRCASRRAVVRGLLSAAQQTAIVDAACGLHFRQRTWTAVLRAAGIALPDTVIDFLRQDNVKNDDAHRALKRMSHLLRAGGKNSLTGTTNRTLQPPGPRYVGHDPLFGKRRTAQSGRLLRWLLGSARYQKYIWAIVAGEPALSRQPGANVGSTHAMDLREQLPHVLEDLLQDADQLAARFWEELVVLDELSAELMLHYACQQLAEAVPHAPPRRLARVREEVAVTHGYPSWASLLETVQDGAILGGIPFAYVEEACDIISRARTARDDQA